MEVPRGDGTDPSGELLGFHAILVSRLLLPGIPPTESPSPLGRPRREKTAQGLRCEAVAVAVDLFGETQRGAARWVLRVGTEESKRSSARHALDAGRRRLRDDGILPWAAWPEGRLPQDDWRRAPELAVAMTVWLREGIRNPTPPPPAPLVQLFVTVLEAERKYKSAQIEEVQRVRRLQAAERVPPWRFEESFAGLETRAEPEAG